MYRFFYFIALFCIAISVPSKADWINLTGAETSPNIAEIYVLDDRVELVMEIYVRDLEVFEDLIPDDWLKDKPTNRPAIDERLGQFSEEKFQIITNGGQKLPAQLQLVEPRMRKDRKSPFAGMINPITRQRVPEAPKDKRVLYVEISYPFEGQPKTLTFVPPLDEEGRPLASIGFIAYHKAVPIIDFRYLGAPATVNLDWSDPWYTKFDNPNLKRHHKAALMSFLYVEPYEVRHEILVRVKDLEVWMDLGLKGDEFIETDELEPLKQRVGEFLLQKNPVRIDGAPGEPILDRTNYVKVSITGIQIVDQPERLEISTAIVGVILAYITDGMPREVTTEWELFTDQIQRVPATSIDPAGPLQTYVDPDDRVHKWTNFLKNYQVPTVADITASESITAVRIPLISVACVLALFPVVFRLKKRTNKFNSTIAAILLVVIGIATVPFAQVSVAKPGVIAPRLSDTDAKSVLQSLLNNVYRAFDFREEDNVYDKLAHSVEGDLLTDVYLQSRKSLNIQRAGGAQARVKEVDVLQVKAEHNPEKSFSYGLTAKWSVLGTVGHWGHVHTRKNLYDALVTIDVIDGVWKITDLELLEEQRVDPWSNAPLEKTLAQ